MARSVHGALPKVERAVLARVPERIIFICGLHRSGTTPLEAWLHSRFDLTVLRGPVPENEGQHLQDILPGDHLHGGPGKFAHAPEMRPNVPGFWKRRAIRGEILRCWTPRMVGNSAVLLEKSPPNLLRIAWLRAVFPGARFIVLTRHPQAVSMATRKWVSKTSMGELNRHWQKSYRAARRDWGPDCLHLRYEDFCAEPDAAMERCGAFLGLRPRAEPLALPDRFVALQDSNAEYLDRPGILLLGKGNWVGFGYAAGVGTKALA